MLPVSVKKDKPLENKKKNYIQFNVLKPVLCNALGRALLGIITELNEWIPLLKNSVIYWIKAIIGLFNILNIYMPCALWLVEFYI